MVEWKEFLRSFQGKWQCVKDEKEYLRRCHGLAGLPGGVLVELSGGKGVVEWKTFLRSCQER